MATVLGVGGVFIKSKDANALRSWYRDMFGFEIHDWGGAQFWSATDHTTSLTWAPLPQIRSISSRARAR